MIRIRWTSSLLLVLSGTLNGVQAFAQDNSATNASELDGSIVVEEVFVTGSLLPKGDFVSKAPIATITSSQFRNLTDKDPQAIGLNSWEYTSTGVRQAPSISNTYTQYYDVYGRTMFMKLSALF